MLETWNPRKPVEFVNASVSLPFTVVGRTPLFIGPILRTTLFVFVLARTSHGELRGDMYTYLPLSPTIVFCGSVPAWIRRGTAPVRAAVSPHASAGLTLPTGL